MIPIVPMRSLQSVQMEVKADGILYLNLKRGFLKSRN